jgi:hypothetical protein
MAQNIGRKIPGAKYRAQNYRAQNYRALAARWQLGAILA